jgi:hypothetical protein
MLQEDAQASFNFWTEFLQRTMEEARKYPGTTDSYLRRRAFAYKTLAKLQRNKLHSILRERGLTPNAVKKMNDADPLKREFIRISKKIRDAWRGYERFSDVLYARLFLKDERGIVPYFINLTVPEEKDSWMAQFKEQFPE